jgi:hypothetical protein
MMFVRNAACVCGTVLLLLSAAVPSAVAQVALSPNGQQINNLVGRGVALADLNGDGTLDAFTVNFVTWQSHDCRVYFGDGKGGFTDSGQRLTSPGPQDQPLVCDLDGNGTKDVLVGRVAWLNDGAGRFSPGPAFLVDADGAPIRDGKLADLNGDAVPDLLVTAMLGGGAGSGVRLYRGDGKGRFHHAWQTTLPGVAAETAIGDVNGDRIPDFVVSGWRNEAKDGCPNRVFLNDGKGQFTDTGQLLDEELRHSHDVVLGDLDRDGDLDMVVVTQGPAPGAQLHLNDGRGRFTPGPRFGTTSIEKIALADFDGDGDLDVFLACIGPDEVWLNDGRGAFADTGLRLGGTAWSWELAVGDINRDGLPDVFVVKFVRDSTAPQERALAARPADVWLNTSRRRQAPAKTGRAGGPGATRVVGSAPSRMRGWQG